MSTLSWPGCANARDLGGLPAAGGGRVRPGALIRSDRPRPVSVEAVFGHGITLVADLRLAAECRADPSPLAAHPAYRNLPVLRPEDTVLEEMADSLPAIYRAILDRGAPLVAEAMAAIATAPAGGVLVHCHSGKDRTGLIVALSLSLAGVADEDIAADYALTAGALRHEAQFAATTRSRRLFAEVTAATMLATLAYLRERYGGAEPYLRGAGLGQDEITLLKARLIDP
ncbi:tyrosine-protein phosphatase [Nonomuraea sp. NPDC050328]|uniref:tyrosine-protein phosphatase n=1 Tax=Nonomuraea sp. NPDC050328 TaxID=3364361 RepID=UPI00378DF234